MSEPSSLSPPMNAVHTPKFWEMNEYAFEDFCLALWLEEGVMCQKYGIRGVSQEGIDLLTHDQPPGGRSVGQCKCYADYHGADLKAAADKFFEHLVLWKERKVRVFRLYVACSCARTSVQTELIKQCERFEAEGIKFELHNDARLVRAARAHPAIVAQYCTDAWVSIICGGGALALAPQAVMGAAMTLVNGGLVFAEWEADRDSQLETIRDTYRNGACQAAYDELLGLTRAASWERFNPKLRGKTLRLLAALELDRAGDVAAASAWIAKARNEDAQADYQVIDALLAYYQRGLEAGLALLETPKTVEAWNLRLALRLSKGESREVLAELDAGSFIPNAESNRLKALALVFQRRVADAIAEIDAAVAQNAGWYALRQTQAIIYYASAISPEFHAWQHLAWPVPADWVYLKSDDPSLGRLREAAVQFGRLLDETPVTGPNRPDMEAWKAGALASHPDTQGEAAQFIQNLIAARPDHYRAVVWAIERGYAFEHGPVRAALEASAATGNAPHDAVIAAVNLAALDEDYPAAKELLDRSKLRFANEGGGFIWRFMAVQVLAQTNDRESAESLLAEEPDLSNRMQLRAVCERIFARHSKDPGAAVAALVSRYEETASGGDLLEAMGAKLRAGDLGWVLAHRTELLDKVRTGGALRLVLAAAERDGDAALCLSLLKENVSVFRSARLPADLARLEVRCLRKTGQLAEAARRATALMADDGRPRNALEYFDAQVTMGDLTGAAMTARLLVGADELPAEALLDAAALISLKDRALSIDLWEEAVRRKPLSNDEIRKAIPLGHRLGRGEALTDVMREMPRLAAESTSGIRMVSIEEGVRIFAQQQEQNIRLAQEYDAGSAPVHTFTQVGWKLAVFYHDMLTETAWAASPLREAALLSRHGSREYEPTPTLPQGRTVVDVTSLLLAAHIDILDLAEQHFGPLRISSWLPTSLTEQLQSVQPHQPEVDADREQILQLVRDRVIGVFQPPYPPFERTDELGQKMGPDWCAALDRVTREDGLLVDFFPLTANVGGSISDREIVVVQTEVNRRVVPVGQLLEAVQVAGVLTPDDLERCKAQLGVDAAIRADPPLDVPRGRFVFLDGTMVEQLARGGVLVALSHRCRLEISQATLDYLEAEVAGTRRKRNLALWIQGLIDRIGRGISDGRYVTFTHPPDASLSEIAQDANLLCLHDLFPREGEQNVAAWCDDRFVNRIRATTAGPILSTVEVLGALRYLRALTDEQYFDKVLELRRANVRYLPMTTEEILHHLRDARIEGDAVEETPALATLRMSVAVALRETRKLQLPVQGQPFSEGFGELRWVFDLQAATTAAFGELWKENEPAMAAARSDWLIGMLRFDATTLADLYKPDLWEQMGMQPFLADTVDLMSVGCDLPATIPSGSDPSRRKMFFEWWYERIAEPMLSANPNASQPLGAEIAEFLNPTPEKIACQGIGLRAAALLSASIYGDLPKAVRQFTDLPTPVREELGAPDPQRVIVLDGHSFAPTEFWRAVAEGINGREATMRDIKGAVCTVHPGERDESGCCALTMSSASGERSTNMATGVDPLFLDDEEARRRFLSAHPEFFDLPVPEREEAIAEISRLPEPAARSARLKERRRNSAENGFRGLADALRLSRSHSLINFFPDDVGILPRHLRLDASAAADWPQVAQRLLADEGLHVATLRLGTLPCRLPERLLAAWGALGKDEFKIASAKFEAEAQTPVLKVHAFHLAAARASEDETYFSAAVEIRNALMASGAEFDGFASLLRWVSERLRQRTWAMEWLDCTFLSVAWNYAARVHNILLQAGTPPDSISSHVDSLLARLPALIEAENLDLSIDTANELNVHWATFLVRSLGDVLQTMPGEVQTRLRPETPVLESILQPADGRGYADAFSQLAAETSTRPDALKSFLGGVWEKPLSVMFSAEEMASWVFSTPSQFADQCLGSVERDPTDCAAWHALWKGTGDAPIHAAAAERVRRLLSNVDLTSLLIGRGQAALGAIRFCCSQARFHSDAETQLQLEMHLIRCSLHCHVAREKRQGIGLDNREFDKIARRLCESAYLLRRAGQDSVDDSAPVCALTTKLVQACPAFGSIWRPLFGSNIRALPFGASEGMWKLFLSTRAAP